MNRFRLSALAVTGAALLVVGCGGNGVVFGPPTITTQPQNQMAVVGGSVTFSVVATGEQLSFQWFKDGAEIPGATMNTLTLGPLQGNEAGDYFVRVRNDAGVVTSNTVTLTLTAPVGDADVTVN